MQATEAVDRVDNDASVPETHLPEPGAGRRPEAAVAETRSAEQDVPVWIAVAVLAAFAALTVAWVGALVALAAWLIRAIL